MPRLYVALEWSCGGRVGGSCGRVDDSLFSGLLTGGVFGLYAATYGTLKIAPGQPLAMAFQNIDLFEFIRVTRHRISRGGGRRRHRRRRRRRRFYGDTRDSGGNRLRSL